jgi:PAS domain S-box-containing protein
MNDSEADISALQVENAALRRRVADLESTAARFRMLLSMMDDLVMIIDKDGRYLEVAPTLSPLVTMANLDLFIGKRMHEVLPADVADHYLGTLRQALATGQSVKIEYMLPMNAGPMRLIGVVTPLSDTTVLWFARDITKQRRLIDVEEELRTFQVLAENTPDGVALARADGAVFYANAASRAMTAYGDAIMGKTVFEVFAEPRDVLEAISVEALARGVWQGELTLKQPSGATLSCQTTVMVLPSADNETKIIAAILRDLTPQRRAEEERLGLQTQVIEAQRAALRELSTPLVPLADGVIAMPLIGTIDSVRAHEVMEKLLEGITTLRARTAILDITGVKVVDAMVADALLKVARAAKLLGADVILTGISPEVARSLIQLGADLSGIVTLGTLESGISYALNERKRGFSQHKID